MLLTSGYGNDFLGFDPETLECQVLKEIKDEKISWIGKHPTIKGVIYAAHEYEEKGENEVEGALSRWTYNGSHFEMLEVI